MNEFLIGVLHAIVVIAVYEAVKWAAGKLERYYFKREW